jgi:hypothetical protein
MRALDKFVFGSLMGASILALSAVGASAAIVCAGNACWHTQDTYDYPSEARVVVHKDDWKWGAKDKYSWREHEGRGYWSGDRWTDWK